jgi:hypothetical protein
MPQHVVAAQDLPQGVCQRALEMVVRLVLGDCRGPLAFRLAACDSCRLADEVCAFWPRCEPVTGIGGERFMLKPSFGAVSAFRLRLR